MPTHPLHIAVADALEKVIGNYSLVIKKDEATSSSGVKQQLPFFLKSKSQRESMVSKVDVLILKNNKVKLVCEIEESGFSPTKIFGKVFSTASATQCRLVNKSKHDTYDLDDNAIFLQVLSLAKMNASLRNPANSKKIEQCENIGNEINTMLSSCETWIKQYHLIVRDVDDFKVGGDGYKELNQIINSM